MATVKGRTEVSRFIRELPGNLERRVLRGAGRAAANVVADEAKVRAISQEVEDSIGVEVRAKDGRIIAKVQTKGPGAYLAPWLEYGTDPHFISVDDSQRGGMSVGRINRLHEAGELVIGGEFVGTTVHHPGARPFPFLRPALDNKEAEAIAAAQAHINKHVTRAGIVGGDTEGAE